MWGVQEGGHPPEVAKNCKQSIIDASMDVDKEIHAQAAEIATRTERDLRGQHQREIEKAVAETKSVLTNTFEAKLKTARQQGHEQGCKDAVSLQQQLQYERQAKAVAQRALAEKEDAWENKNPDLFVVDKLKALQEGKVTRSPVGVYYEIAGGSIFFITEKNKFQTAWLKQAKENMQEPYANYAVIVSESQPGPRQLKEIKDANRAGVYVCSPKNVFVVAHLIADWMGKEQKQALVNASKEEAQGLLYDFVTGGEMASLQSMFIDSMKAEDKAIKGLENQLEHLKTARRKKLENFNVMIRKMSEKAVIEALPSAK